MTADGVLITETIEDDDRWEWERIARDLRVPVLDTTSTADLRLAVLDAARVSLIPQVAA